MVLCGHDHRGGYHRDHAGVHHLTLCSPLNKGVEGHAYGLVQVHDDHIELAGPRVDDVLRVPEKERAGLEVAAAERHGVRCEVRRFPI